VIKFSYLKIDIQMELMWQELSNICVQVVKELGIGIGIDSQLKIDSQAQITTTASDDITGLWFCFSLHVDFFPFCGIGEVVL
ncbi:10357_t:CDS:1, partial [Ambispora gerdemannii]